MAAGLRAKARTGLYEDSWSTFSGAGDKTAELRAVKSCGSLSPDGRYAVGTKYRSDNDSRIDVIVVDSRWMAFDIHNLTAEDEGAALVAEVLRALRQRGAATLLIDHDNKSGTISGFTTKTRFDDVVIHLVPEDVQGLQSVGMTQLTLSFDKDRHRPKIQPLRLSFAVHDGVACWDVLGEAEPKPKKGAKRR